PDGARLGDEVADGEDEAVLADDDAVAGALRAEDLRGERVVRDLRPQADDAIERVLEVETPLLGPRPHLDRKGPFALFARHVPILIRGQGRNYLFKGAGRSPHQKDARAPPVVQGRSARRVPRWRGRAS